MVNKKAFSFVEIIITISIIALLAVVGLSLMNGSHEKADNTKVVSDIETINNALESLSQESSTLPMPGGNKNFFQSNTEYAHAYSGTETFGVYGSITEDTIAKKYLDILPLDPRTNSYYSYGKTKNTNQFEVAGVKMNDGVASAIVTGNYTAENGPYGLIREYNGANFVYDKSENNLPYNPEELVLIVTDNQGFTYREGDKIRIDNNGDIYKNGSLLHAGTDDLELFFSDGSVSILEKNSELTLNKLDFPKGNNLTTFVQLALETGTIWTRATKLNDQSEFEIQTTDSTAAVRGTIFAVSYNPTNGTDILVIKGKVEVAENNPAQTPISTLEKNDSIKVKNGTQTGTPTLTPAIYINTIKTKFKTNTVIRTADEIEDLRAQNETENEIAMQEIETQNPAGNTPSTQIPAGNTPSTQNPAGNTPSTQIPAGEDEETGTDNGDDNATPCAIAGITGTISGGKCEITQTLSQPSSGFNLYTYSLGSSEEYDFYINGDKKIEEEDGNIIIRYYYNGEIVILKPGTGNLYMSTIYSGDIELKFKEH